MKNNLNTYKVFFEYSNGQVFLQFSLRCVNEHVASVRIQCILQNAYIKENYVKSVNNIIILENNNIIETINYSTYLKKYGLIKNL